MNPMLQQLAQQLLSGRMQNNPLYPEFNRMMAGKSQPDKFKTLLNAAKSQGFDVDAKVFTKDDLRTLGLTDIPAR